MGKCQNDIEDTSWGVVSTPHSVKLEPAEASGCRNYQGIAWYRKTFIVPGNRSEIYFEAIMGKQKIYVNGKLAKEHFGGYLPVIVNLKEQGPKADSAISLIMPESYVGLPFMDVDEEKKEIQKKTHANHMICAFVDHIIDKDRGIFKITRGHWPRINSRLIGHAFIKWIIGDSKFRVDPQRCIHCGKCASVCPTDDIEWSKGECPEWKHNGKCLSCFACYHHLLKGKSVHQKNPVPAE